MGIESFDLNPQNRITSEGAEPIENPFIRRRVVEAQNAAQELFALLRAEPVDIDAARKALVEASERIGSAVSYMAAENSYGIPEYKEMRTLNNYIYEEVHRVFNEMFAREMASVPASGREASLDDIPSSADFEGDNTNLLIARLSSPTINGQLNKLIYLDRKYYLFSETIPTEDEVRTSESELINAVATHTPIIFEGASPSASKLDGVRENIDIKYTCGVMGEEYGIKQKNISEAHEKGHTVRKMRSAAAEAYFGKALDLSRISISEERAAAYAEELTRQNPGLPKLASQQIVESIRYYLTSPMEVVERMSQLKNYFGMADDTVFTREHLQYAREHYVEDTKMDNNMQEFFQAITPETEDYFIKVINEAGV